jgi:peptidyl-prolyl cis-trans isomerase D
MDQKNFSKAVKVGVIDRVIEPASITRQQLYSKANALLEGIKNQKDFEKAAVANGISKRIAENIKESDKFVTGLENPREIIRWAYKADEGDVSPLFEAGNKYVIACLTQVKEKGYTPAEYLKAELEAAAKKEKKAEMLAEKLEKASANATTIDQVAQKAGVAAIPADNISFGFPVIPAVAREAKVVGSLFGMQPGKISRPLKGDRGVYVAVVDKVNEQLALPDYTQSKMQASSSMKQRAEGEGMEALKEKAKLRDNRVKFF